MSIQAKSGDRVRVHYVGRLSDGSVFDSSHDRGEPLDFVIGEGKVLAGFEQGIVGLGVSEGVTVTLSPEEAYGEYDSQLTMSIPKDSIPPELSPEKGMTLAITSGEDTIMVTIIEVQPESVTVDGNHPLAGKSLTFECELVELFPSS
ncbi:MAG: peptidylprolyl isomerase [Bdellovibrionales bacterium]|nr:peptidylprolyl isomerase [Bdellovibrionales bacterium]